MEGVTFDEEPSIVPTASVQVKKASYLSNLVISLGLAKTTAESEKILLVIAVIAFIVSVVVVVFLNSPVKAPLPASVQADIQRMDGNAP